MDWPLMVDSLNILGFDRVPFTIAVDEHGIIREFGQRANDDGLATLQAFLQTEYEAPEDLLKPLPMPDIDGLRERMPGESAEANAPRWRNVGDACYLWGDADQRIEGARAAYARALKATPGDGRAHFRLGVTLRRRYDSALRQPSDFQAAVEHWTTALDIDPNNYIWRRRIQQYGPRLDKPYSFYDWVRIAREEITARGGEPVALVVEPSESEFATPWREFESDSSENPDPNGRLHRDKDGLVAIETAVAPAHVQAGKAVRVHVTLRPVADKHAHWNNEAGKTTVWVDLPDGWSAASQRLVAPIGEGVASAETRVVEVELRAGERLQPGSYEMPGYALYHVCEDADGVCWYLRQDFTVTLVVR